MIHFLPSEWECVVYIQWRRLQPTAEGGWYQQCGDGALGSHP